jgi:ferredoxin-NADP reductase
MTAAMNTTASRWRDAVVESVGPLTPRIASVQLRASLAPHVAGQHLDVRLTAPDGYAAQRSYSIASAPGAELFELAIEKLDDGEVSPFFHEVVQPGDTIEVRGPLGGHFIWRPLDGGPLLLVAGGSGIAPLMAMLRDWAAAADADGAGVPLLLVYSARTWEELAFRDEIATTAARHPTLDFVAVTTRGPRMRDGDLTQRLDAASIRALLQGWGHRPHHTFICGANRFVDAVANALLDANVAAGSIRTERYGGA